MSKTEELTVELRDSLGSGNARRLRRAGQTPAVVYGHGEETVSLSVRTDEVMAALNHGSKLVQFKGAVSDAAIICDVQWDGMGSQVMHVDFSRVLTDEKIELSVPIETRGDAPGSHQGGTVRVLSQELQLECPVTAIPDKISVSINELALDQTITAAEIELPEGAKLLTDPTTPMVQCIVVVESEDKEEDTAAPSDGAEPEVIGKKEEDEGGGE